MEFYICRICENLENLEQIFSEKNKHIPKKMREFADLRISNDDGLPQNICTACIENLEFAYNFRLLCTLTDSKYRKEFKLAQTRDEDDATADSKSKRRIKTETSNICQNYEILNEEENNKEMDADTDEGEEQREEIVLKFVNPNDPEQIRPKMERIWKSPNPKQVVEQTNDIHSKNDVLDYINAQANDYQTKCKSCCESFDTLIELADHLRNHASQHKDDKDVPFINPKVLLKTEEQEKMPCDICGVTYSSNRSLAIHKRVHSNQRKVHVCDDCGMKFKFNYLLQKHTLQVHRKKREQYKCQYCDSVFNRILLMRAHEKSAHPDDKPFKCEICNKKCKSKDAIRAHLLKHKILGEIQDDAVELANKILILNPFECETCHKQFTTKSSLRLHMRQHMGVMPYKCAYCDRRYHLKESMKCHQRLHLENGKPFQCEVCSKSFNALSTLQRHIRCHTGERPFGCDICGKTFRQKNSLNVHTKAHTGEKPFQCQYCGKAFSTRENTKEHERIHLGLQRHKCEFCNKRYNKRLDWVRHRGTHLKLEKTELEAPCDVIMVQTK